MRYCTLFRAGYHDKNGHTLSVSGAFTSNSNAWVELSKTIEATGTENEFIVTMDVKTKQDIKTLSSETPDAATVLVIDVSNSMDVCVECGSDVGGEKHNGKPLHYYCNGTSGNTYYDGSDWNKNCDRCQKSQSDHNIVYSTPECAVNQSRMEQAKDAAIEFVRDFGNNTGAIDDDKRMVSVVLYGSDAWSQNIWYDVATASGLADAEAYINSIEMRNGSSDTYKGGTNFEAGLMLAKNVINGGRENGGRIEGIDYLYTILLTDGEPTYHVNDSSDSETHIVGVAGGSSKTFMEDAKDVGDQADAIRAIGGKGLSKLYSICMGEGLWDDKAFGNWDDANPVTTDKMTIGQWLTAFSTAAYDGEATNLFDSFDAVMYQIQLAAKAWRVADWMGDHITYLGEVDIPNSTGNGMIYNSVINHPTDATYADARYGQPDYVWNILGSEATHNTLVQHANGTVSGYVGYTYKYKVRLENQHLAYHNALLNQDGSIPVNDLATLKYAVTDAQGNWPTNDSGLYTATFRQPEVKGLLGELKFDKVDQHGEKIHGGIAFRLRADHHAHEGEQSEAVWEYTEVTTDENGRVVFSNIPSGHDYTLIEAATDFDSGYNYVDGGDIAVDVDWGEAKSHMTDLDHDGVAELVNTLTDYPLATIVLEKAFGADSEIPASIRMLITGRNNRGNVVSTYERILRASDAQNGVWTCAFTDLEPSLKWTVEEMHAQDANGNPLKDKYNLAWAVSVNGQQVDADVFVQGEEDTYPVTPEEIVIGRGGSATVRFTNTMTRKVGSLTVSKAYEGLPQDAQLAPVTITVTPADGSAVLAQKVIKATVYGENGYQREVFLSKENNWTQMLPGLPMGSYAVVEDAGSAQVTHFTLSTEYSPAGSFTLGGVTTNGAVDTLTQDGETKILDIWNTYTQELDTITVRKSFAGDLNGNSKELDGKSFTVTISDAEGTPVDTLTLSRENGWSSTSKQLAQGQTYTLAETGEEIANFDWTAAIYTDDSGMPNAELTLLDTATANIVNTYTKHKGSAKIVKTITGNIDPAVMPKTIAVLLTNQETGDGYIAQLHIGGNAEQGWGAEAELTGLPVGLYKVEESPEAQVNGYNLDASFFVNNKKLNAGDTFPITKDTQISVNVENEYTKQTGWLEVTKAFGSGMSENLKALADAKTYTVFVLDQNGKEVAELKLTDANDWKASVELPLGTYTLLEESDSAQIEGYTLHVSYSGAATVESNETAYATVTNTYAVKKRVLELIKHNVGNPDRMPDQIVINITPVDTESDLVQPIVSELSAANSWTQMVSLEPGAYTLTENTNDETTGITWSGAGLDGQTVSGKSVTVTIPHEETARAGEVVTVICTNDYEYFHDLTFYKLNSFNDSPMKGVKFTLEHSAHDTACMDNIEKKTAESDKDGKVTFTGIEAGHVYTLTETAEKDYTTMDPVTVTVSDRGITVTGDLLDYVVYNTPTDWPTKDLTFTKLDVQGRQKIAGIEFALKHSADCPDCSGQPSAELAKTWRATSGTNGKVEFTGLPVKHTYILEETKHEGYLHAGPWTVVVSENKAELSGEYVSSSLLGGYEITNEPSEYTVARISFLKHNSYMHAPLPGAVFTLTHDDAECKYNEWPAGFAKKLTATSDANGLVEFLNVPTHHRYILAETNAPEGFTPMEPVVLTVGIGDNGEQVINGLPTYNGVIYNNLINWPELSLTFKKFSSVDNTLIQGIGFMLKHDDVNCDTCKNTPAGMDKLPAGITGWELENPVFSGADGIVTITGIPAMHRYTLTEIANDDYAPMNPIVVRASRTNVLLEGVSNGVIYNMPAQWPMLEELSFYKYSTYTQGALTGVQFTLEYRDDCKCAGELAGIDYDLEATSNAQGLVKFENVPEGHGYLLSEVTPEGYVQAGPWRVNVYSDNRNPKVQGLPVNGQNILYNDLINWPTEDLTFKKIHEQTEDPIEGIEFALKHSDACPNCSGKPESIASTLTATSNAQGMVVFEDLPVKHTYTLSETKHEGYHHMAEKTVRVDVGSVKIDGVQVTADTTITNKPTQYHVTKVSFKKFSNYTNAGLAGAQFKLEHSANCQCDAWPADEFKELENGITVTSAADGTVEFADIPTHHSYTLTETLAPQDYIGLQQALTIVIDDDDHGNILVSGLPSSGVIYNRVAEWPKSDLEFYKHSKLTNGPIEGIEFTITHSCEAGKCIGLPEGIQNMTWTATSDEKGLVRFEGLPLKHEYTLTETKHEGYYPVNPMQVSVTEDGVTVSGMPADKIVYNVPVTWPGKDLSFYKYSNYTKAALEGVKFTLTHSDACVGCSGLPEEIKEPKEVLSDEKGLVLFTGVPVNHTYVISENEAPAGYAKMADLTVTVTQGENGVVITGLENGSVIYNVREDWPKENITFTKISAFDGRVLAGATFDLVHIHDAQAENYCCAEVIDIAEATTDIYGKVTLTDVPRQHIYVLTETKAPEGYKAIAPIVVRVIEGEPIMIGSEQLVTGFAIKDDPTYWPVEIQLTASKTMNGEVPTDEYTFVISGARGEIERVKNVAGTITFSKYLFEKPGRYEFEISELAGEDPTVIYDSAVYTAIVNVKADAEGKMSAQVSLKKNGLAHEGDIEFANMNMPTLPETGDNSRMALWCAMLAMAGVGMMLMKRKRA